MVEIVLHVGAHRTGTTSVQKFLYKNQGFLRENGIETLFPPATRESTITLSSNTYPRVLISEENILGTMENNIWKESLYPDVAKHLLRHSSFLTDVQMIYLSIRNPVDWWASAISFITKSRGALPNKSQLQKIANSPRKWSDVINDVKSAVPSAKIVVREFSWKSDNPKQQLRHVTKWGAWNGTVSEKSKNNGRPTTNDLVVAFTQRGDLESLHNLPHGKYYFPFGEKRSKDLDEIYFADLKTINEIPGVKLLVDMDAAQHDASKRLTELSLAARQQKLSTRKVCFLHIGKTGGTYIKSILENENKHCNSVFAGGHSDTILTTMSKFGRDRKLAFFFRNPTERFISGFNSRLRQGRPTYNANWSPGEAVAFSYFATPNELAEALFSIDERQNSAARFAFREILHLKKGYTHYLISKEILSHENAQGNISICCETSKIDRNFSRVFQAMGVSEPKNRKGIRHEDPNKANPMLSPKATKNLEKFWKDEFAIYRHCQLIACELGFDT